MIRTEWCAAVAVLAAFGLPHASARGAERPLPSARPEAATRPGTGTPGGGRGFPALPKPGPAPLPILPALPRHDDTAFYARVDSVPHGKVEQATYKNYAGKDKRLHVYLPPGYDRNPGARYPVLYLNHGGGDDDSKWTSTDTRGGGSAQYILDNLITAGKARPMIVVMPDTRGIAAPDPPAPGADDACTQEYLKDIIPFVESRYRARPGRENRALAGLSMGGFVVMNTGLSRLDTFGELYVYSSGYFPDRMQAFEENFKAVLADPRTNAERLRVPFYMAQGETDIALRNGQNTVSVLNRYGVRNFWVLSSGGHEWANWRRYLHQTAQIMFPQGAAGASAAAQGSGLAAAPAGFDVRREGIARGRRRSSSPIRARRRPGCDCSGSPAATGTA